MHSSVSRGLPNPVILLPRHSSHPIPFPSLRTQARAPAFLGEDAPCRPESCFSFRPKVQAVASTVPPPRQPVRQVRGGKVTTTYLTRLSFHSPVLTSCHSPGSCCCCCCCGDGISGLDEMRRRCGWLSSLFRPRRADRSLPQPDPQGPDSEPKVYQWPLHSSLAVDVCLIVSVGLAVYMIVW